MSITDRNIWGVIHKFFEENGFVRHQLESYNDAILRRIPSYVEQFRYVTITEGGKTYKIEFGELTFAYPTFTETDDEVRTIYPMECSWRNINYTSDIYVDIMITPPNGPATLHQKVLIGSIPVMKNSCLCNLRKFNNDRKKLAEKKECIYDQGGYFEVNGSRKIIVCQERSLYNEISIFKNRKTIPKYELYSEVRSSILNGAHSTVATVGYLNGKISTVIQWIDGEIPLRVLLLALGASNEHEITQGILGKEWIKYKDELKILVPTLEMIYVKERNTMIKITSREDALFFIGRRGKKYSMDEEECEESSEDDIRPKRKSEAIAYATNLLSTEFIPHLGRGEEYTNKKMLYVCYMIKKLLQAILGKRQLTDRDGYYNKTIATAGQLLAHQFYGAFRKMINEVTNMTYKALRNGSTVNILSWINDKTISSALLGSIVKDCWNSKGNTAQGICQLYEQFNYVACLSNARKLAVPISKDGGKIMFPRLLHGTHNNIVCISETPEGKKCGLVKHIALMSYVTIGSDSSPLIDIIYSMGVIPIEPLDDKTTKVMINGDWIGMIDEPHELAHQLRLLKRSGAINVETSITYNPFENEVRVSTEAGRLAHPLLVVDRGKILLSESDVLCSTWSQLLRSGMIELLDKREEEEFMICPSPSTFASLSQDDRSEINYCEPHAALVFGISGSIIPYADHNQSPKNTYQCLYKDELVLMSDGKLKAIENVKVGDTVYTFNPITLECFTTKVVGHISAKTTKKLVKVFTSNGRSILVTEDHKFLTNVNHNRYDLFRDDPHNHHPINNIYIPSMHEVNGISVPMNVWMEAKDLVGGISKVGLCSYVPIVREGRGIDIIMKIDFVQVESITQVYMREPIVSDITVESDTSCFIGGQGFCVHNSSMSKQAIGIPFTNYNYMYNGKFHILDYMQKPICYTESSKMFMFDKMPSGQVAHVAVMPFIFNQEDSVEMNLSSVQRGFMSSTHYVCYYAESRIDKNEVFEVPIESDCDNFKHKQSLLDIDGVVSPGTIVCNGDVLIGMTVSTDDVLHLIHKKKKRDISITYDQILPGVVKTVQRSTTRSGYPYIRVVVVQRRLPLCGDKFSLFPGQKGTVGMLWNQEDLPFRARDGMVPDIIFNSLSIPSRMTMGTLIELFTGKCVLEYGKDMHNETFKEFRDTIRDATISHGTFSLDDIRDELRRMGMNGFGEEMMIDGRTGEPIKALIFEGFAYYQRLKHMVVDKVHARAKGGRVTISRQPKPGRREGGGQRCGVMERDCLISQGVPGILRDRLMEQSDEYKIWVCDLCGLMSNQKECALCQSTKISLVRIPYATKLALQELMGMGVVCRILTTPFGEVKIIKERTLPY